MNVLAEYARKQKSIKSLDFELLMLYDFHEICIIHLNS